MGSSNKKKREKQKDFQPPINPVGTHAVLVKLLPLISDSSTPVRSQLLKLFRELPSEEVRHSVEQAIMFIRAGMTHLSADISNDSLGMMEWLLDVAENDLIVCPGGWVKTLNSFCAMMGWALTTSKTGWSSGTKAGLRAKDASAYARQIATLARFLEAGLRPEAEIPEDESEVWDNLYRIPQDSNAFEYLNLYGTRRDEEGEMYPSRDARQRVFERRFLEAVMKGADQAKKEGGATGRAAAGLDQVLQNGMGEYESSTAMDTQDLLSLW
ncbi:rRNA processing protein [Fusarium chlamydosporum]